MFASRACALRGSVGCEKRARSMASVGFAGSGTAATPVSTRILLCDSGSSVDSSSRARLLETDMQEAIEVTELDVLPDRSKKACRIWAPLLSTAMAFLSGIAWVLFWLFAGGPLWLRGLLLLSFSCVVVFAVVHAISCWWTHVDPRCAEK